MNRKPLLTLGLACAILFTTRARAADVPPNGDDIHVAPPVIPDKQFNLKDYGAVGDYRAMDTDAFTKAIAAIKDAGGGHLIVPEGIYKTLQFSLVSHMDLHLDPGAVIKAPDNFKEYGIPDPNDSQVPTTNGADTPSERGGTGGRGRPRPLISGSDLTDVSITGSGKIDGSGQRFWAWSDKQARLYPPGRRIVGRPVLVSLMNMQRLHIDGVTLTNSPTFHLVPRGSDILIENIRIVAPSDAPNTDAIDPGGERIIIRNSEIDTGDDDVAIQQGSHDVLIEGLTCLHGHGISIGSGTTRGVSHMIVRNCSFDGTDNGMRIKSFRGSGGEVHDIWYSDITMKNVRRPFDINMLYNGNTPFTLPNGQTTDVGTRQAEGQTRNLPNFHDIHVTNWTVTHSPVAGRILGLPEQPASNITFTNVKIQSDRGFLVQDAKDITFDNATITATVGESIVTDNGSLKFNEKAISGNTGGPAEVFYAGN